jgi:hypothetical protein
LLEVARSELQSIRPIRPRIAAAILEVSERAVRSWTEQGILTAATLTPRLTLDPGRPYQVWHLVHDLRDAGRTPGLLDEVYLG